MLSCIYLPTEVKKLIKCLAISCGWVIFLSSTINVERLKDFLFFLQYIILFIPCHKIFELFLFCSKKFQQQDCLLIFRRSIILWQYFLQASNFAVLFFVFDFIICLYLLSLIFIDRLEVIHGFMFCFCFFLVSVLKGAFI